MNNYNINDIKQILINNLNGDYHCRHNCIEILNRYMDIGPYDDDTLHEILRGIYNNKLMLFVDNLSYREEQYDNYGYDEDADYINMNSCTLYSYSDLMDVYLYLLGGTREHEEYEIYSESRIRSFAEDILRTIDNLDDILLAINKEYGLIIL